MTITLNKALVVFDLETTGLDIVKDRIIQIAYIKIWPDEHEERNSMLVNPGIPIPDVVTELTGISDKDVQDQPTFKELAPMLLSIFDGADYAGFNSNHFDLPILVEEFYRAGLRLNIDNARMIDVQTIYHKMEPRNLAAAYKFYCGRKMSDDFQAHLADQDTEATYRTLLGQLKMYNVDNPDGKILKNDVQQLADFCKSNFVDLAGRIVWQKKKDINGKDFIDEKGNDVYIEVFNFGKYKGKSVADVLRQEPGFYTWMMSADFSQNTKEIITRIKLKNNI